MSERAAPLETRRRYHISGSVSWPARGWRQTGAPNSGSNPKIAQTEDFTMNRFDFTPYRRTMVGFDRLF
ncbi:MAG: hypothetical protein KGM49_10135, partial [Sphingomonadales bacterium]|nr:hypothetical protein [Sphingomonadales bacterium]